MVKAFDLDFSICTSSGSSQQYQDVLYANNAMAAWRLHRDNRHRRWLMFKGLKDSGSDTNQDNSRPSGPGNDEVLQELAELRAKVDRMN